MFSTMLDMFELSSVFNGVLGAASFASIAILFKYFRKLPIVFKYYQTSSRKKQLIKIKNNRNDDRYYLYELQKSQNWFFTFLIFALFNIMLLIMSRIHEHSILLFLILMLPSFILEAVWLNKLGYIEDLRIYQKGSLEWKKRKQRKNKRGRKNLRNDINNVKAIKSY